MGAAADERMDALQTSPLAEEQPGVAQRFTKKDVSTSLRNSESGMVDQVMLSTNAEGQRFVKLRVRGSRRTGIRRLLLSSARLLRKLAQLTHPVLNQPRRRACFFCESLFGRVFCATEAQKCRLCAL